MTTAPTDQAARDRFAKTLDRNFSVIAAAGSGKTRAVTDRIAQLAQARDAEQHLAAARCPHLCQSRRR